IPHMSDPAWHRVYAETQAMLHTILQTDNDIIVMTAPGSGAIETGLGSLFQAGEQVIVVNNGMFAGRILQILDAYGCQAIAVDGPWGEAIALEQVADTLRNTPGCAGLAVVGNETGTGVRNPVREL